MVLNPFFFLFLLILFLLILVCSWCSQGFEPVVSLPSLSVIHIVSHQELPNSKKRNLYMGLNILPGYPSLVCSLSQLVPCHPLDSDSTNVV